ncbi:MAG: hypothetical protein HZB51_25375 [Chloroflexi bacterium]|nr:hypothetical protein [Chloroflexota bacterium]
MQVLFRPVHKSAEIAQHKYPAWVIWLFWIVATFVGGFLYSIPVGVVNILLGLDRLEDPVRSAELTTPIRVLAAVLCGAACGSTIGLAQWFVLRRELNRDGWWVAATIAGYASIGLLPLIANIFQPGWLDWAIKLIVNGKMHWLARVVVDWPDASWAPGAMTLTLFGAALGFFQWLVLRGRVSQAGWWIALSTVGWALAAALNIIPSEPGPSLTFELMIVIMIAPGVPVALAGAGMVWLLRRSAPDTLTSR